MPKNNNPRRIKSSFRYQVAMRPEQTTSRQQVAERSETSPLMELQSLRLQVCKLTSLLHQERAICQNEKNQRVQLADEFLSTKNELVKQKRLKEMYINRGKEARRDLERLEKYSTEDAIDRTKIAIQVRDTNRQKKKKHLHADYEELQVAHLVSTEKFTAELQAEREKSRLLQEELDGLKVSHHKLTLKYDQDVLSGRQLVESLQRELQQQTQNYAERSLEDQRLIQSLREEQDALRQKMAEEVALLQQNAFTKEQTLWAELEELKTQLCMYKNLKEEYAEQQMEKKQLQERFTAELQGQQNKILGLQEELERSKADNQELQKRYEVDISAHQKEAETIQEQLKFKVRSQFGLLSHYQKTIGSMQSEKESLLQEVNLLKKESKERETDLLKELQELKKQMNVQLLSNNMHSCKGSQGSEAKTEEMETTAPKEEEDPGMSWEEVSETQNRPSIFKQARHLLGLRKPQRWKNK